MKKIKSFQIDHNVHFPGFYLSGVSNNIYTYDLRFKMPNGGDYLDNSVMHTIEHIFATVIRNSDIAEQVVYFGPMGCRTGFYLLLLDIGRNEALDITKESFVKCLELDEIPGGKQEECGNYLEHDLQGSKREIGNYLKVLDNVSCETPL